MQSAKSRTESRRTSGRSKNDEPVKLPSIYGDKTGGSVNESNDEMDDKVGKEEEPKVEELNDYGKLVKAIEGTAHVFQGEWGKRTVDMGYDIFSCIWICICFSMIFQLLYYLVVVRFADL